MHATPAQVAKIMKQQTCSVEDAAKVLGIGRRQAYEAARSGEIRSIRIRGRILIPTSALRELLDAVPAA